MFKKYYYIKQTKLKILMSYIVLLVLVVTFITVPLYLVTAITMKREISSINIARFRSLAELVDNNLELIDNSVLNMCADTSVTDFVNIDFLGDFSPEDIQAINKLQMDLAHLARTSRFITNAYLYNAVTSDVVTSDGGFSKLVDFQDDSWFELLEASSSKRTWSHPRTDRQGERYLSLIRGVPVFSPIKRGAIIVNIAEEQMKALMGGKQSKNVDIALLNRDGELIYSAGTLDQSLLAGIPDKESGYFVKDGYIITYYASKYTNWIFASVTDEKYLMRSINRIFLFALTIAMLVLILSSFLIDRFSGMVYRPIQNTVEVLGRLTNSKPDRKKDEFEFIVSEFNKINLERQYLRTSLEKSAHAFRAQFLKQLLEGSIYEEKQLARNLNNAEFELRGRYFAVVILEVDDMANFIEKNSAADRALWLYGINNIAEELFSAHCSIMMAEHNGRLVGLLNSISPPGEDIKKTAETLKTIVFEKLGISLTVVLGGTVEGIEQTELAYAQAKNALKRKFVLGMFHTIYYEPEDDLAPLSTKNYMNVQHVVNGIKAGDLTLLEEEVNFFHRNVIQHRTIDNIGILMANVLITLKDIVSQLEESGIYTVIPDIEMYRELSLLETADQLSEWLRNTFAELAEAASNKEMKGTNYIEHILEYIDSHYTEDISLISIADMVGISPSYVSTIINAELNTSLANYINRKRIEDAKKILIQNKNLPMDMVREMVGYSNVHTFMRVFKKYEGVTPGKYREMH